MPTNSKNVLVGVVARVGELLCDVDDLLALGVVVGRDVVAGVVLVVVVDAVDRRLAVARAARIPADDVEALQELLALARLGAGRELGAAEPGPPGLTSSDPILFSWSSARRRARNSSNVGPSGSS